MNNKLYLTLDGPRISEHGVPVDALVSTLQGVQDAFRLMVESLVGYQRMPRRTPKRIREQGTLQLATTSPGSFVAELVLDASATRLGEAETLGEQALIAFQLWDGGDDSTLPRPVVTRLRKIPGSFPRDMSLWLGDSEASRRVEIRRMGWSGRLSMAQTEDALLYGWLKVINWDKRTARLHRYGQRYVRLHFDAELDDEMRRFGNQYVEVRGEGLINRSDRWQWVRVEKVNATRSSAEPFDMEAFLNNPNPKIFDPETVITASEPFDVDEFLRFIREGRDA